MKRITGKRQTANCVLDKLEKEVISKNVETVSHACLTMEPKKFLLDFDLTLALCLISFKYAEDIVELAQLSKKNHFYITDYCVFRLQIHLNRIEDGLAEKKMLWLEKALNVVVVSSKLSEISSVRKEVLPNWDYSVEVAAAQDKTVHALVALSGEHYENVPLQVITLDQVKSFAESNIDVSFGRVNEFAAKPIEHLGINDVGNIVPIYQKNSDLVPSDESVSPNLPPPNNISNSCSINSPCKIMLSCGFILDLFLSGELTESDPESLIEKLKSGYFKVFTSDYSLRKLEFFLGLLNLQTYEDIVIWLERELTITILHSNFSWSEKLEEFKYKKLDVRLEELFASNAGIELILSRSSKSVHTPGTLWIQVKDLLKFECVIERNESEDTKHAALENVVRTTSGDAFVQLKVSQKEWKNIKKLLLAWMKQYKLPETDVYTPEFVLTECLLQIDKAIREGQEIPIAKDWFYRTALKIIQEMMLKKQLDENCNFKARNCEKVLSRLSMGVSSPSLLEVYETLRPETLPEIRIASAKISLLETNISYELNPSQQLSLRKDKEVFDSYEKNFQGQDLSGLDLARVDLSYANLEGADLSRTNLSGANLRKANLRGAALKHSNLQRADLEEANLYSANLERSNLDSANLQKASLIQTNLKFASLRGADLQDADLTGSRAEKTNFRGANLRRARVVQVDLSNADLISTNSVGAIFDHSVLRGATLNNSVMTRASLREVDLSSSPDNMGDITQLICVKLTGANLVDANLSRINAKRTNFSDAKLIRVDLSGARLLNSNFEGADLEAANLHKADLGGAILTKANLSGANLSGSLLRGASLKKANLNGANLNQASLQGAYLNGVTLCSASLIGIHAKRAHFNDANLEGTNLDYAELVNASFERANLKDCTLIEAQMSGSILDYANLQSSDLSWAVLRGASFKNANIMYATMKRVEFQGAYMKGCNLQGALIEESNWDRCRLKRANLVDAKIKATGLRGADLRYADFTRAELVDVQLENADLSGSNFSCATLKGINLDSSNLSTTIFQGANLSQASMAWANLNDADLSNCILTNACLYGARLSAAKLEDADLEGVNLYSAILNDALFIRTNLSYANLYKAYLSGAIFDSVSLDGAKLENSNLIGVALKETFTSDISLKNFSLLNIDESYLKMPAENQTARTSPRSKTVLLVSGHNFNDGNNLNDMRYRVLDVYRSLERLDISIQKLESIKEGFEEKADGTKLVFARLIAEAINFFRDVHLVLSRQLIDLENEYMEGTGSTGANYLEFLRTTNRITQTASESKRQILGICLAPQSMNLSVCMQLSISGMPQKYLLTTKQYSWG